MDEKKERRVHWIIRAEHEDVLFDHVLAAVVIDGVIQSVMIAKPNDAKKEE